MSVGLLASTGNTFLTCVLEDVRQNNDVFPQGRWEALPIFGASQHDKTVSRIHDSLQY